MRTFPFVSRMPALSLACAVVMLAGCEQTKSASPLSPSIAGPIAGVEITAPVPMQPPANRRFKPSEQPISLAFGNPQSNGVRPYTLAVQVGVDLAFSAIAFSQNSLQPGADGVTRITLPGNLQSGRIYFWRARADDGANSSDWSPPTAFEILQPVVIGVPTPLSPIGNVRATSTTPELRIRNAPVTGPHHPLQVNFQVSQTAGFSSLVVNADVAQGGGETTFTVPSSPGFDVQLFWRARTYDTDGNIGGWSVAETYRTPLAVVTPPPGGGGGGALPPGNCASNNGPAIVKCIEAKYPDRTAAGVSVSQRVANMEFLRDRIIEAGLCGGMDLGRNLKRGGPEISIDFLVWRSPSGDIGIDIGAAYDDTSIPLRLQWSESIFPFYQAYPKPSCG